METKGEKAETETDREIPKTEKERWERQGEMWRGNTGTEAERGTERQKWSRERGQERDAG